LEVGIFVADKHTSNLTNPEDASITEEFLIAALELKQLDWSQVFMRAIC